MGQIILHADEAFIEEDRDYYFSGERDKHNQVRPDQSVYSTAPFSAHLDYRLGDGKVGNFFFPAWANSLDRIYIGISVPLFANSWGASFLLELLKVVKPGGSIVLPVYPEGQAAEKGYWSRSFLENIFLSRSRWRGMSNIYAENDGVMSMRVGRKWPDPMPSSAEWFFRERSNLMLHWMLAGKHPNGHSEDLSNQFIALCRVIWKAYQRSAIVEKIIADTVGAKSPSNFVDIGNDYGLLANDLVLSHFVNVAHATHFQLQVKDEMLMQSIHNYFSGHTADQVTTSVWNAQSPVLPKSANIVLLGDGVYSTLSAEQYSQLITQIKSSLAPGGVLIVAEMFSQQADGEEVKRYEQAHAALGAPEYYSNLVACKQQPNYEISHYSTLVEGVLANERDGGRQVYRVYTKS